MPIVLLAVIVALIRPDLFQSRVAWNEKAVMSALETLGGFENSYRMIADVDQDNDGYGEWPTLKEMTGQSLLQ